MPVLYKGSKPSEKSDYVLKDSLFSATPSKSSSELLIIVPKKLLGRTNENSAPCFVGTLWICYRLSRELEEYRCKCSVFSYGTTYDHGHNF